MIGLRAVAAALIGTPYLYGGNHPADGLDCGGYVQIILLAGGADPSGDQSAQALYDHFKYHGRILTRAEPGALVFFGTGVQNITHVAWCWDEFKICEAGGGDSTTVTRAEAIRRVAMVRMTRYGRRADQRAVIMPNYIGVKPL